jgi:type II secretory pathway pseudopilin PulG
MSQTGKDNGFTLVSLMVVIILMGIAMATIAPTWRYLVIRDREEELLFRGEQYQIAISRYQKKFNTLPTKLDELLKQKCIRRLFKDPITRDDFELIYSTPGGNVKASRLSPDDQRRLSQAGQPGGSSMPIVGVVSTSPDKAIRPWKEKEYYNEWEFIAGEEDKEQPSAPQKSDPDESEDEGGDEDQGFD